ncbi:MULTISPECIES: hypothetical protein [Xanthomonas]|uniref:hypothetical protein n=1 Tax=Xanthomonas TaxID=338 RepID=UPI001ADC08BF|nr:hypothetical protein [Xanthomonas phaseoli]MBO9766853.1 hypothetical protein [Xanthomonas phaseoli pv. dieffenbachiae]MBO9776630.1 hypothetical protein [Xanthomonas phaseoli pv. dieffenbachiae]MBO9778585.1 hypothetical protein [Xanthomonas phaseoli pv. dieffenbachiae]MBO9794691.1 hypothetical protein [Xanthomonas phaseoli pv. dieffenbachiae]MBO9800509.1 hypothetical protein [Xanthomonas phaseoli pv. dieffenbachiae]
MTAATTPLTTPDGRYLIVRERLWRTSNPHLSEPVRAALVSALMDARRAVKAAKRDDDAQRLLAARRAVDAAKVALGERGTVWWTDGARDFTRHLVKNTPYAAWFAGLHAALPRTGVA